MLSKLLKYELRASGRILLPVYALLLVTAGCCSLFYKLAADHPYRPGAASVLMGLLNVAFWIFVVATGAITALLMIYRFYKNYMTDEGYLMFTLPVSVHQLLWSKLLVSMLWFIAGFCVDALALVLTVYEDGMFAGLPEFVRTLFDSVNREYMVNGALYMLELLGVLLVSMVTACLMFYAPIAIGNSFATHKTLLSVVFYFVIQTVLQIVTLFGFSASVELVTPLLTPAILDSTIKTAHLLFTSLFVYELVIGAILYVLTWFMLRKKLNLQ